MLVNDCGWFHPAQQSRVRLVDLCLRLQELVIADIEPSAHVVQKGIVVGPAVRGGPVKLAVDPLALR